MMHTTEQHVREEVTTLLEEQHVPTYVVEGLSQSRTKQALRALVGVIGAVALVAGSAVAVEMLAADTSASTTPNAIAMNVRSDGGAAAPSMLESRFGWDTVTNGWCSIRANTWCLFKSDKEACKKEIHDSCDSKPEEPETKSSNGSDGSGSGSDSSASGSRSSNSSPNAGDPTKAPTAVPTAAPTQTPTKASPAAPTQSPTKAPTAVPIASPIPSPT